MIVLMDALVAFEMHFYFSFLFVSRKQMEKKLRYEVIRCTHHYIFVGVSLNSGSNRMKTKERNNEEEKKKLWKKRIKMPALRLLLLLFKSFVVSFFFFLFRFVVAVHKQTYFQCRIVCLSSRLIDSL